MSTVAAKKTPIVGRDPTSSITSSPSPSRATPRSSTPTSTPAAGGSAPSHARSRSFRSGTPVSARAAAGQRRESPLSSTNGSSSNNAAVEAEEAARAETIAAIDDLRERLSKAETASEEYRKQAEVLQSRFDEATKEQVKYEEKCHEHEEQIESLQNEHRESTRKIREMEAIYEAERSAMVKEKEDMSNREEELQMVIARLKDSLNQKMSKEDNDDEPRSTRSLNPASPGLEGSFAPPASLQRSDSKNQSKLVMQKDKLIESLRLELAEAQIKLVESENRGGGRLQEVEKLLMETRMANARLMEDNESYQLLLQEKTLNGDFKNNDFSYMGAPQSNDDALAALEGKSGGASLADELNEAVDGEEVNETVRRLETEVRAAKDQNKALTLYINRIIERLLEHQDFEHILDQTDSGKPNTNKDLPSPPQASGASVLDRAKSMATAGPAGVKPRQRPMSVMPTNSARFSNPVTAPSIPIGLGRSHSTRRVRPMSEQITGAASLVNQMYKGPDGPLSPGIRSSQTFFNMPQHQRERNVSGATAASMPGNFNGMRSETSSVSGDSSSQMTAGDRDTISSTPNQSPPRERKVTQKFDAGNKPRPLRLVQENNEAQAAANKRQSWIGGWFSGAGKKDEATSPRITSPRESIIRE